MNNFTLDKVLTTKITGLLIISIIAYILGFRKGTIKRLERKLNLDEQALDTRAFDENETNKSEIEMFDQLTDQRALYEKTLISKQRYQLNQIERGNLFALFRA